MGLRINSNVISLQAQNRLARQSMKLAGTLERLSTGLRINKGRDDVVGLLKSESLRSQLNGISASRLNLSNAQNLLGVAEGSLAQLTELAQRMRSLVVQAADATISSSDRDNLDTAIADLQNEYSRLALASEFDSVSLLQGTFTSKTFQVGPKSTDTLTFSISDARSSAIGQVAVLTSNAVTANGTGTTLGSFTGPTGIVINGVTLTTTSFTGDGVSNVESSESAIAYVTAINSFSGQTSVTAEILANVVTLGTYSSAAALTAADFVVINGVTIDAGDYAASSAGADSLVSEINEKSTLTGVSAANNTTASAIVLTASDGRNVDVIIKGANTNTGVMLGIGKTTYSHVGYYRGTFKLYSSSTFTLSGATDEISATTAVTLDATTTLSNLNVNTSANATTGIFILDNVIKQLQSRRADVGSKSIRMEIAEGELNSREENLKSAESRIRDADIAKETADLTAAQILQQAGVSVLARANSIPQIALTLLQG